MGVLSPLPLCYASCVLVSPRSDILSSHSPLGAFPTDRLFTVAVRGGPVLLVLAQEGCAETQPGSSPPVLLNEKGSEGSFDQSWVWKVQRRFMGQLPHPPPSCGVSLFRKETWLISTKRVRSNRTPPYYSVMGNITFRIPQPLRTLHKAAPEMALVFQF